MHKLDNTPDPTKPSEINSVYIDPTTLNYKYSSSTKKPEIGYSENGFVEAAFTNADYAAYDTCPPTPYFLSETVP